MSPLEQALEEIEQAENGAMVLTQREDVDVAKGWNLILVRKDGSTMVIGFGWGASGTHADVRGFNSDGEQIDLNIQELLGTVSLSIPEG